MSYAEKKQSVITVKAAAQVERRRGSDSRKKPGVLRLSKHLLSKRLCLKLWAGTSRFNEADSLQKHLMRQEGEIAERQRLLAQVKQQGSYCQS